MHTSDLYIESLLVDEATSRGMEVDGLVDQLRNSFISCGVSGRPTMVLIDEKGVVWHRQVGYNLKKGLTVEGWSWAGS